MNILLLTLQFLPERTGNAPLLGQLCEDLTARGHRITLIAGPVYQSFAVIPERYRRGLLIREGFAGATVWRVANLPISHPWARKLATLVYFPLVVCLLGPLLPRPDVILCPSPPLWLGLAAAWLGLVHRAPFIYVVQDLWPDAPIRLGLVRSGTFARLLKRMELLVYRLARHIIVIASAMRDRLSEQNVAAEKITTIPNWVDVDFFRPCSTTETPFRSELGLSQQDFVILYSGNMGRSQALEVVLQAASHLKHCPELVWLLIGEGTHKKELLATAKEMNHPRVYFHPLVPKERLPEVLASADLCLSPLRSGLALTSVPSKLYTYMAAGKAIVASLDKGSPGAQLLEESGAGLVIEPDDPSALAQAVAYLHDHPEVRSAMGERGRKFVENHCTRATATRAYEEVLLRTARSA